MTVYSIINTEKYYSEMNYSSTDKELLEEIICDSFMEDILKEFNWLLQNGADLHNIVPMSRYAWNLVFNYYKRCVYIRESELV